MGGSRGVDTSNKIDASLALRKDGRLSVSRDRVDLLEAVAQTGSISAAARQVGLSYKAAWDALNAVNNLLPAPVLVSQAGGRKGGGAAVTPAGLAFIAAFRALERRLDHLAQSLSQESSLDHLSLLWSLGMKTSARNALHSVVKQIKPGAVNAELVLCLTPDIDLIATITQDSVEDLGLAPGQTVVALVKSSFVMLAPGDGPLAISTRNKIPGTIIRLDEGAVSTEVVLDIGGGKTVTAIITKDGARELGLAMGSRATAFFKASHVILAVD